MDTRATAKTFTSHPPVLSGTNLSRQLRMAIQEASSLTIYNLQSSHINYQFTKCISQTFIVIQVPSADFTCSISLSKKTDTSIARTICNGILRESTYPTNLQAQNQTKIKIQCYLDTLKADNCNGQKVPYLAGPFQ